MNSMQIFSKNLSKLLSKKGNKSELARYCKVSPAAITYWANCEKFPSPDNLDKIAAFFQINVSELFKEHPLSFKELELLSKFNRLNDDGQNTALGMLDVLLTNADMAKESA